MNLSLLELGDRCMGVYCIILFSYMFEIIHKKKVIFKEAKFYFIQELCNMKEKTTGNTSGTMCLVYSY